MGGMRDVCPPGPHSLNIMYFLGEFGKIVCRYPPGGVGIPSSGKSWIHHWYGQITLSLQTPPPYKQKRDFSSLNREKDTKGWK